MRQGNRSTWSAAWRTGSLAAAALAAGLLFFVLLSVTRAQEETPDLGPALGEEDATPDPETDTVLRVEVDEAVQPVESGDQFEASVYVENVENLAAFDFSITYDPERIEPVFDDNGDSPQDGPAIGPGEAVQVLNAGQFIEGSDRGATMECPLRFHRVSEVTGDQWVTVSCNTFAQPVCIGGPEGASGSGLLGAVLFRSLGGGDTTLELSNSTLVLDDVEPCDPDGDFRVVSIPHRRADAEVRLAGNGVDTGTVIGAVVGAVVIAAVAGSAGLLWYRRRQARSSS